MASRSPCEPALRTFDLFRLVELHNADGDLSRDLRAGPPGLARIVADDIVHREVVVSVEAATRQMSSMAPAPVTLDDVRDIVSDFVDELQA